jgi:hypothetical protein
VTLTAGAGARPVESDCDERGTVTRTLTAAAAAAAVVATSAGSGPAATGPGTIRITDVQSTYTIVSAGDDGPGDVELVRQRLYNRRITSKPIGHARLICTYFDRRSRQCQGTYVLPKGKLVVAGALDSRLLYQLAVIGGTALYENARGTLTVTSTGLRPRRELLLFRLLG